MDTAGRAVTFAGLTVVISLLGLLLIGLGFLTGMAIGAAVTVGFTMVASVTLLPALLGFVRERIEVTRWGGLIAAGLVAVAMLGVGLGLQPLLLAAPLAVLVLIAGLFVAPLKRIVPRRAKQPVETTLAYRWSRVVQAHPWASLILGSALLLVMALPVLSLRLGFSDESNYSEGTTTRRAYDLLVAGFGPGFNGPLIVTAEVTDAADRGGPRAASRRAEERPRRRLGDRSGRERSERSRERARLPDPGGADVLAAGSGDVPTSSRRYGTTWCLRRSRGPRWR